jgi:DNA sulfur modification protein DndB
MVRTATVNKELYNEPMQEVEAMLKRKNDLKVDRFATISGIRGMQFGKEIFATVLKFKDLRRFLEVFPNVQRNISPRKVSKIKTYTISGVENPKLMRFFPAITVTARGNVFYDTSANRIAIDTENSNLSVNDGQHRFYGIDGAIEELKIRSNKAKEIETKAKIDMYLEELENMVIPMTIFNNLTEEEEMQLFYDSNNLASRPSRSATIKLAQNDYVAKMARELSETNKSLIRFGVEMDKMSIQRNNPNTILLTTVYAMIKNLYWTEYIKDYSFINETTYNEYKMFTVDAFNKIFASLPKDMDTKDKYILGRNYALKGIAKYIHFARLEKNYSDSEIFEAIKNVDWSLNLDVWSKYGAYPSEKKGILQFGGNGEGGIRGVQAMCMDKLKEING